MMLPQFIACSKQPEGAVDSCTGTTSITEDVANTLDADYQYTPTIGQYVRFARTMTVREIMVLTYPTTATTITVTISRSRTSDTLNSDMSVLKSYTLAGPFTAEDSGELWLSLPEPFEFLANTADEDTRGEYYFVSVAASGGSFGISGGPRDSASRMRQGVRPAASPWGNTDTSYGYAMGFRGLDGCQGF